MRTINAFILLCVFCLFCQPTLAQRRVRLVDLPPFERAVVVVKYFEGHTRLEELSVCWIWASAATRRALHSGYDGTAGGLAAPC